MVCKIDRKGVITTAGSNISDFTRYTKKPRSIYYQALLFPTICFAIAFLGVISASASKPLYGEYIWDPLTLASKWTSPPGRLGAFYCGLAWCIAQIGVNVSANVISVSNDLTSLFPKYINPCRAAFLPTLIGGWIMVPWRLSQVLRAWLVSWPLLVSFWLLSWVSPLHTTR
jgi:NCS1 family nucleobase:cation symporter-1